MILNSGRHTQPDPQSCRARSLGGRKGGEPKNKQRIKRLKQNWAVRRPIVTKRFTANANTEKSIPPAMSQRNQHLTHAMLRKPATTTPKQFQTTWRFGKDWQHAGGGRDLQSATVFPGILPFRYTCKSIAFCESCAIFRKKGHCSNLSFGAVNTLAFWTRDWKRARQIDALERVAILYLGLRHDARNAPSCFKSSPETIKPHKAGRMTSTSTCWTGEDHLWKSKFYIPSQPPKMGIKQIEQFSDIILRILRFLAESSGVTKLELFQPFLHCK